MTQRKRVSPSSVMLLLLAVLFIYYLLSSMGRSDQVTYYNMCQLFRQEKGSMDFYSIARRNGLTLLEKDTDYVVGGRRYFSDYISGRKCVNIYAKSVGMWAKENGLEYQQAVNLILSHEYYHFLEVTQLGLTSRDYQVPALVLGPLKIGKTGIRALSEIGAHGFARTYYELWLEEKKHDGSKSEL